MSNVQLYTKAVVYINGNLLTEESNVTVDHDSNSNEVNTVAKGYAGESPGATKTMISMRNAVPSADFEFNPAPFINNMTEVEVSVFAAGKTLTVVGFIHKSNFQHGVGNAAELSFDFRGGPSDWQ